VGGGADDAGAVRLAVAPAFERSGGDDEAGEGLGEGLEAFLEPPTTPRSAPAMTGEAPAPAAAAATSSSLSLKKSFAYVMHGGTDGG